ncbi:MAG TPA: cupin domain-containing protein [Arenibaculum sp.]|nr:cupin domain-containing protein [Arenibaculum sp.]
MESHFDRKTEARETEMFPGFMARFVHSERMTVAHWRIQAGNVVPEHAHPHEQIVNCLSGRFEMTVGDETVVMEAGDVAVVPPNVPHKALAITDCFCLDIFTPVREDYRVEPTA